MKVEITNLHFEYPARTFRLAIPELQIDSGAHVAVVGPSGSGKTTLLRLIAGIFRPDTGRVTLDSLPVSTLSDAERRQLRITRIGFVFQDFQLIDYLNVAENIRLPFRIHRSVNWSSKMQERLNELAASTGIAGKLKRPIANLSHGEKQRVAICRALIAAPSLVLADEPTGNLDPENKRRILRILFDETRKRRATLVMVTHDRDLLHDFDRVVDFADFQSAPHQ